MNTPRIIPRLLQIRHRLPRNWRPLLPTPCVPTPDRVFRFSLRLANGHASTTTKPRPAHADQPSCKSRVVHRSSARELPDENRSEREANRQQRTSHIIILLRHSLYKMPTGTNSLHTQTDLIRSLVPLINCSNNENKKAAPDDPLMR